MQFTSILLSAIALQTVLSTGLPSQDSELEARNELEVRNNVGACQAILIALKASAFCSSFVPITDTTKTATQTGTAASTQVTVTAPCTNPYKVKRGVTPATTPDVPSTPPSTTRALSTTPAAPSTTRAISTTPAAPSTTRAISTTPAAPSTTAKISTTASTSSTKSATTTTSACRIRGLPPALSIFACDVIRDACIAFVKPKTVTVTTYQPGKTMTGTKTVTPTCPITTTRIRTTASTTPSTTPSTTTSSSAPLVTTCSTADTAFCASQYGCVCGIVKDDGSAYCIDLGNQGGLACNTDADCGEGSDYRCQYLPSNPPGVATCNGNTSCNQPSAKLKRGGVLESWWQPGTRQMRTVGRRRRVEQAP